MSEIVALDGCEVRSVDPERVTAARTRMITSTESDRLADWFRVLGDPTRTRALYAPRGR